LPQGPPVTPGTQSAGLSLNTTTTVSSQIILKL
jgi:hypothetical protein